MFRWTREVVRQLEGAITPGGDGPKLAGEVACRCHVQRTAVDSIVVHHIQRKCIAQVPGP